MARSETGLLQAIGGVHFTGAALIAELWQPSDSLRHFGKRETPYWRESSSLGIPVDGGSLVRSCVTGVAPRGARRAR